MRVDLTGKRFGRLTVNQLDSVRGNGESYWLCTCDCGNQIAVSRGNLKLGITKSCGCLQKETTALAKRKHVQYDLSGDYGIGYAVNNGIAFLFDLEDYDLILPYSWFQNDQGYIVATGKTGKQIRMHKLVVHFDGRVDHRNNNRSDNRKINLRSATAQQNAINRGCNKNNRLGIKGVSKIGNRYYARIMKDGKTISLGGYATADLANNARKSAEQALFGEYAYEGGGHTDG